jgi:hypothetical protein
MASHHLTTFHEVFHHIISHVTSNLSFFTSYGLFKLICCLWLHFVESVLEIAPKKEIQRTEIRSVGRPSAFRLQRDKSFVKCFLSHSRTLWAVCGAAPSCWNHACVMSTPFRRSAGRNLRFRSDK